MALLINRTREKNRHAISRERFLARIKHAIRSSIRSGRTAFKSVKSKTKVRVTTDTIIEPHFSFSLLSGDIDTIVVQNTAFNKGEQFKVQLPGGSGGGSEGDNNSGSEDSFEFFLNEDEYRKLIFEGFKLPNFVEKDNPVVDETKYRHAGFTKYGLPSNLNIGKTYQEALGRRLALKGSLENKIKELEKVVPLDEKLIEELNERLKHIPFFDDIDLRYNTRVPVLRKITTAVVFFMLDISGSMYEEHKDIARRFFYMYYMFLKTQYKDVEVVFIAHTNAAKIVTEKEFFFTRESGGTEFLPAYTLLANQIKNIYKPSQYNLYVAHASDSDSGENMEEVHKYVMENIYPSISYGTYIHISPRSHRNLGWMAGGDKQASKLESLFTTDKFQVNMLENAEQCFQLLKSLFSGGSNE